MLKKACWLGGILLLLGSAAASAQNAGDFMRLFGGMMQSAVIQANAAQWRKLPPQEVACIDSGLRHQGTDLNTVIRQGITPSDPRLAALRAECARPLRTDDGATQGTYYVANAQPPDAYLALRTAPSSAQGSRIATMPNGTRLQVLRRRPDGWWYVRMIQTGQQGWALSGHAGKVWIQCCATDAATSSAAPARSASGGPSFDCKNAYTQRDVAICNSDELSFLDRQYGQYWKLAQPLDNTGIAKRTVWNFYQSSEACNASVACIRTNFARSIDYLAGFLKAHGIQVSSYAAINDGWQRAMSAKPNPGQRPDATSANADQERQRIEAERAARQQAEEAEQLRQQEEDARQKAAEAQRLLAAQKAEAERLQQAAKAKAEADADHLKEARDHGFSSYSEYQDYLAKKQRLLQSGIQLNPR